MLPIAKSIKPRIIIHGGAGAITRGVYPHDTYGPYRKSLRRIIRLASDELTKPGATALDVATYTVALLEDDPIFNAGKGSVYTRIGTLELDASVMVSRGYHKRASGCMLLQHVKNPVKLAREILIRGEEEDGGGAQSHILMAGPYIEQLARRWGLEMVEPPYFWTENRWEQHRYGLERGIKETTSENMHMAKKANRSSNGIDNSDSDLEPSGFSDFLPKGTVGCVVLDSFGTICSATSTGGLTNKLPGRIGDTATMGAGYWAEEWIEEIKVDDSEKHVKRVIGLSGTGHGDSFLRLCAARTIAALSRFSNLSLKDAIARIAGPSGELEHVAGDRFMNPDGQGGFIGIELIGEESKVVYDMNCGGMFRAWFDEEGRERVAVFNDENGLEEEASEENHS